MQAMEQTPTNHKNAQEKSHSLIRQDRTQAHEHLELDGVFWLETEGAQLSRWFARSPRSHVALEAGGWIALSGEPWFGFNVACVLDSPRASSLFIRYAASLSDQPGIVIVEKVTPAILELAQRADARHLGEIPLMAFDEESVPSVGYSVAVRQIVTLADLTPTVVLIAGAFSMNLQACLDLFEPTLEDPNATIWVAEQDGRIISALMSLRIGSIVGLHCLATSKEYRGQGISRSLVCQVMGDQMSRGIRRFFLHTTPLGRRFAESIGYRPVGFPHGFVVNDDHNASAFPNQ